MATPNELLMQCPIPRPMAMDPRWRSNIDPAPNCPRCASSNTKFCYYNNYSLSQPRYFCKGCRRYWTRGGSLRNVPLGGGCRKTRRSRSKALAASSVGGFGSGCSSNSSSESGQDSNNAPDIDMAAVFARFLSNDQSNDSSHVNEEINEVATTTTPSESSHESLTSTSVVFDQEFQITDEFVAPSKHQQIEEEETFQEFVTSDFAGFDGIVDDVFWSNELTWQPVPELEEFDSPLLPLDQSTISHDNWSGLDDMVYEAFPRY